MAYRVTLIAGDGTGPEIMNAARRVIEATGVKFDWDFQDAGVDVMEKKGTPLPDEVLESIRKNGVAWKGPVTTPVGKGFRSVNVALRHSLELYCCLRPCKWYRGIRSPIPGVDLVIVRENMEDLYAGVEFESGTPEAKQIIEWSKGKIDKDAAISIKPISERNSRRIIKFAFDYAVKYKRKSVSAITKANIMKFTDGLFLRVAREVAKDYEGKVELVDVEYTLVDNMSRLLVMRPKDFDVLVLPNLYGDILSDLCAGLVGGLGVAPGANIGEKMAVFEATHGSAPRYKGQNKVNPSACLLSGMLMLRHLGEMEAADKVERAFQAVIEEGKDVTYDMKPTREDPSAVGTKEMGDAIIAAMKKLK